MTAPPRPDSSRLDSLTGIRFFAALLVFGFHGVHFLGPDRLAVLGAGMAGVSLFYILSGFVLSWTASSTDRAVSFYQRRFARIYPAFIAAWILSLAVGTVGGTVSWWDVLLPPTVLQAWIPLRVAYFAGSAVFWSLSCEAFFYVLFPWIHRLLVDRSIGILVGVVAAAVTTSLTVATVFVGTPVNDLTRWILVIFPPLRLMEFVIGLVLGIAFRRGLRVPVPIWLALSITAVACLAAAFVPFSLSRYAVTLVPFVILIGSLATGDLRGSRSFLRSRPIVALGVWSYCFYLLHAMVLIGVFSIASRLGIVNAGNASWLDWTVLASALAASILAAWVLHRVVEHPLERRLRRSTRARLDDGA